MEVDACMKYIIADPDLQSGMELMNLLEGNEILVFQGNFITFEAAENFICEQVPDIAFIWMGKATLNAFKLAKEIKLQNPLSRVIFMSNQKENAVEAFEYEVDGFLLKPYSRKKIKLLLQQISGDMGRGRVLEL